MKRILVVDDGGTVRMYHRTVLEEAGFVVEEAGNGLEGIEKALDGAYDLLLVDINMPKMDGLRMVHELRAEAAVREVPAIMITTESQAKDKEQAYLAGANYFMIKPVRPDELRAVALLMTGVTHG
ncbi:MAG: response regulator [Magnetococcales bacterium]|nr:response regulator [Magnetococcales bacterium]MBF0114232.1 response regulator [Magnetococcales bacterium]